MELVNTEDSPYELSLEITASGNAQNLIAGSSIYSAITESDARLGGAVSLSYYGGDVEKVKLTYEIGESYISNEGSEYAKNCVDLQGIKRYNIFRYFEELNMLLPLLRLSSMRRIIPCSLKQTNWGLTACWIWKCCCKHSG